MIAQSWETLDGLSLLNPGKPQMSYDCTILGNPRWLIIAQSWETLVLTSPTRFLGFTMPDQSIASC